MLDALPKPLQLYFYVVFVPCVTLKLCPYTHLVVFLSLDRIKSARGYNDHASVRPFVDTFLYKALFLRLSRFFDVSMDEQACPVQE